MVYLYGIWEGRTVTSSARSARQSKDLLYNKTGSKLITLFIDHNLITLNGLPQFPTIVNITFISQYGQSVVGYGTYSPSLLSFIKSVKVEPRTESDHLPVLVLFNFPTEVPYKSLSRTASWINIKKGSDGLMHRKINSFVSFTLNQCLNWKMIIVNSPSHLQGLNAFPSKVSSSAATQFGLLILSMYSFIRQLIGKPSPPLNPGPL